MNYLQLKDVCKITMGQSPDSSSYNENGNGMPFFQGNADFGERYPDVRLFCSAPKKVANRNDILISVRAPIGALNYANVECCIGRGLAAITPNTEIVSSDYIYWLLKGKNAELNRKGTGSTFKAIGKSVLEETKVPNLPLDTQIQFANVLEKVYNIINQRHRELDKLDELVKARFVELFGAQEYEKKQLIELIQEGAGLSYGIVVPGDNVEGGIPMVRPSDFKNGSLNLDNVYKVASVIECKYKKTRLNGDEILVQVIGQPGQVMLSDERCKGMNVTRNLAVIRIDKNKADRLFISHYLTTEDAQRFMFGSTNQSTLKQLPLNKLKELPIPLVPVSEQKRFAMFVKQVDKSKVVVQKALDEAQLLFDSLMQEFFG